MLFRSEEEVSCESATEPDEDLAPKPLTTRGLLDASTRNLNMETTLKYNLLEERKEDQKINDWKSFPGLSFIISQARRLIKTGDLTKMEDIVKAMEGHRSQQTAPIVASIAIIVSKNIESRNSRLNQSVNRRLTEVTLWDVELVSSSETWPTRRYYSFPSLFPTSTERIEAKKAVHGYLGRIASREMDLFFSQAEMKRLAHRHEGVWIAPTRSTFNSYLPDIYPELPYLIHQNSPLAWSILTLIHRNQDHSPLQRSSTNLHRQKNTLYLESLRYAVILHAKKILKTIEDNCMK